MKVILKKSDAQEPYTFSFINSEGKSVIRSENYAARKSAENGIESVRKNCLNDSRYEMNQTKNGKFYFNLKAGNGQIVGTSAFYASQSELDHAISLLKKEGPNAPREEQI